MAKKNLYTDCPKCKSKKTITFNMSEPNDDGFSIHFDKCTNCEHTMTKSDIDNFLHSVDKF